MGVYSFVKEISKNSFDRLSVYNKEQTAKQSKFWKCPSSIQTLSYPIFDWISQWPFGL